MMNTILDVEGSQAIMLTQQQQTIVDDRPYTTADEDPFSVQPYQVPNNTVKHRRSSMLDKWITEQQNQNEETTNDPIPEPLPASPTRPFATSGVFASSSSPHLLAYPELPRFSFENAKAKDTEDDAASIISYDLVDDDDIPEETISQEPLQEVPVTPIPHRTHKSPRHSISPSFRSIGLPFNRPSTPAGPSSPGMEAASRAFARLSFFPRTPRSSTGPPSSTGTVNSQHIRTSSLSTLESTASQPSPKLPQSLTSSKCRPSVLGHFPQSSISQVSIGGSECHYAPSRPSISSGDTYTTWNTSRTTTTIESVIPPSPSKFSLLDSIRVSRSNKPRTVSRMSVASGSSVGLSAPQTDVGTPISANNCMQSTKGTITRRVPLAPKSGSSLALTNHDDEDDLDPPTYRFTKQPAIPYSPSRSLSRVKFASLNSRASKKKKLIISGVGATEIRKLEGVKRWCESFGEVRSISRMPNGDLQIDFRDPDVADTVCRVRAKVFIAGVGSVHMSWMTGTKR